MGAAKQPTAGELLERARPQIRPDARTGCWKWTGSMNGDIPRLKEAGAVYSLLRVSYAVAHGALPAGRIERTCGNARCIAPAHMRVVEARPPTPPPVPQVGVESLQAVRVRVRERRGDAREPVMDYVFYGRTVAEARARQARHRTLDRLYATAAAGADGLDAQEMGRRS